MDMRTYFFTMDVAGRNGNKIGVRTGFVRASSAAKAEEKAWRKFGSDYTYNLNVWPVNENEYSYTVYASEM